MGAGYAPGPGISGRHGGQRVPQAASALHGHGTEPVCGPVAGRRSARLVARALFALTKPRIIELLLVTTLPTMLLARRGVPSAWVMVATLTGGALAAASANTLNCFIDRDIDARMRRTSRRPLRGTRTETGTPARE